MLRSYNIFLKNKVEFIKKETALEQGRSREPKTKIYETLRMIVIIRIANIHIFS